MVLKVRTGKRICLQPVDSHKMCGENCLRRECREKSVYTTTIEVSVFCDEGFGLRMHRPAHVHCLKILLTSRVCTYTVLKMR